MTHEFIQLMQDRRSIRSFDPAVKISQEEMLQMIEEATTAPSSVNMQPWRFHVVQSEEVKAKLKPLVRFNVNQLETSSAMILIFGDMKCQEFGPEIYNKAVDQGKMSPEVRDYQLGAIMPMYDRLTPEQMNDVVKIDASLAAMQLMLVAKVHGYDTNAIGGFEADQLADAIGLDSERYVPVMILAIGKGMESGYDSVRLEAAQVTAFY